MWHYVQNGQGQGPVETVSLQALLKNGSLSPDALVWKDGMADWAPARSLAEFAACVPSANPPPPIPPLTLPPRPSATPENPDPADIERNKIFAILAYLGILFLVPLLAAPHSRFARYHTNQGIVLFLSMMVVGFWHVIPFVNVVVAPLHAILWPFMLVLMVLGIIHAASGEYKPLPIIGHFQLLN